MNRTISSIFTTIAAASLAWVASPAVAATLVNTELVLSVDVSPSISTPEFELQRQGYANAFRDPELLDIITGLDRGLAVTLQYWAGGVFPAMRWHHITDAASANVFADAIAATNRPMGSGTNIAAGLHSATNLLLNNEFEGDRQVIDLSGDGSHNQPFWNIPSCPLFCSVASIRDTAVEAGITINGLPIAATEQSASVLDNYFQTNVIGGEGAFTQVALGFNDFDRAVKTKLKREIQDPSSDPVSVPEPTATLGLLVFGYLSGLSLLKRKRDLGK